MHRTWIKSTIVGLIVVVFFWGCGSSGDSSNNTVTLSGNVADGYLQNARCFLDENDNGALDEFELSTLSGAGGAYALVVPLKSAYEYPVVCIAEAGVCIDEDTNQTLSETKVLSAPIGNETFISPLSTLIHLYMRINNEDDADWAAGQIGEQFGIDSTLQLLGLDYISESAVEDRGRKRAYSLLHTLNQYIFSEIISAFDPDASADQIISKAKAAYESVYGPIAGTITASDENSDPIPFYVDADTHDHDMVTVLFTNSSPMPINIQNLQEVKTPNKYKIKWQVTTTGEDGKYSGGFFFKALPAGQVIRTGVQVAMMFDAPILDDGWGGELRVGEAFLTTVFDYVSDQGFESRDGFKIHGYDYGVDGFEKPGSMNISYCQHSDGTCIGQDPLKVVGSSIILDWTSHKVKGDWGVVAMDYAAYGENAAFCMGDMLEAEPLWDPSGFIEDCMINLPFSAVDFFFDAFAPSASNYVYKSVLLPLNRLDPSANVPQQMQIGIRGCYPKNVGIDKSGATITAPTAATTTPTEAIGIGYECTDLAMSETWALWTNFKEKGSTGEDKFITVDWDLQSFGMLRAKVIPKVSPGDGITFDINILEESTTKNVTISGHQSVAGLSNAIVYTFYVVPEFSKGQLCYGAYTMDGWTSAQPGLSYEFKELGCYPAKPWDGASAWKEEWTTSWSFAPDIPTYFIATAKDTTIASDVGQRVPPYSCSATASIDGILGCGCFSVMEKDEATNEMIYKSYVAIDACGRVTPGVLQECPDIDTFIFSLDGYDVFLPGAVFAKNFRFLDAWGDKTDHPIAGKTWRFFQAGYDIDTKQVECSYTYEQPESLMDTLTIVSNYKVSIGAGNWQQGTVCHTRPCGFIPEGE